VEFAHLHAFGRDSPFALLEIELIPGRRPELSGSHEHVGRKTQRGVRGALPVIALDRAEQPPHLCRIGDRGIALAAFRCESTLEIGTDVPARPACRYGIPEHPTTHGSDAVSGIADASFFEAFGDRQEIWCFYARDGAVRQIRTHEFHQLIAVSLPGASG
jgi:hypothetical protein